MSKYTTEVRYICENYAGYSESQGFDNVDSVIASSWDKIFGDFPIWSEDYRSVLACKILKHYYTREIGAETVGLWKLWLNERMELIMPYYNQLYETVNLEYNPLSDTNYTLTGDRDLTGKEETSSVQDSSHKSYDIKNTVTSNSTTTESSTSTSDTGKSTDAFSDTPQGALTGLEDMTYLSEGRIIDTTSSGSVSGSDSSVGSESEEGTVNSTGSGTITDDASKVTTNTDDYVEKVVGKRGGGSYQSMIKESIELLKNIDNMIIEELKDLFMLVW